MKVGIPSKENSKAPFASIWGGKKRVETCWDWCPTKSFPSFRNQHTQVELLMILVRLLILHLKTTTTLGIQFFQRTMGPRNRWKPTTNECFVDHRYVSTSIPYLHTWRMGGFQVEWNIHTVYDPRMPEGVIQTFIYITTTFQRQDYRFTVPN